MRIAWAMDVFAEESTLSLKMAQVLTTLTRGIKKAQVEPVYVLSPGEVDVVPEFFHVQTQSLQKTAEKHLKARQIKIAAKLKLVSGTILLSPDHSLRMAVTALVNYAKQTKVDLVAVTSSGKKGVSRLGLGSFAETVIMHSDVPVFILNSQARVPKEISTILFPTDLSEKSRQALMRVIPLAKERGLELILFHSLDYLNPASLEIYSGNVSYATYIEEDQRKRRTAAENLKSFTESQGIKTQLKIVSSVKSTAGDILALAKKTPRCFIAMAGQTGPFMQTLLGHVTREIIRKAPCPLWIVHT